MKMKNEVVKSSDLILDMKKIIDELESKETEWFI